MSAEEQETAEEVVKFLDVHARTDVKALSLQFFLGLTGTRQGLSFVIQHKDRFLTPVYKLTQDETGAIVRDSFLFLINLSGDEAGADAILSVEQPDFANKLLSYVKANASEHADSVCMILSNLTRTEKCCAKFYKFMLEGEITVEHLISMLCQIGYNEKNSLDYLAPLLSNLTQLSDVRKFILEHDKERQLFQRLLPFTTYSQSSVRRGGVVGAIRNCCFESTYHPWLLGDVVDLLPRLLLPLAGGEELSDEEMEKLPIDLQYLPAEKTRDYDADIRKMLVEALIQLCATKIGRMYLKDNGTYVVMREYYEWETARSNKSTAEKLIQILIGDEPEPGMEDLHKVEISSELTEKFKKMDAEDDV